MLNPPLIVAAYGTISAAAAIGSGLDISALTGDYTLFVRIGNLSSATGTPSAIIAIEDTVDNFTGKVQQAVIQVNGQISGSSSASAGQSDKVYSFRKNSELPNMRAGTASAKVRVNVLVLGGGTPSLTVDAWIE
jgi:hypothetical protein